MGRARTVARPEGPAYIRSHLSQQVIGKTAALTRAVEVIKKVF
jgi:hypothetical protein